MTVHWSSAVGLAPLHIPYYTQIDRPERHLRIAVQFTRKPKTQQIAHRRRMTPVTFDPQKGEGWFLFDDDGFVGQPIYTMLPDAVALVVKGSRNGETVKDKSSARFHKR